MERKNRMRQRRPEFRESLGMTQPLPVTETASASYITSAIAWTLGALAIVALMLIIAFNLYAGSNSLPSNVPAGTQLPLNGMTLNMSRASQAAQMAVPLDSSSNTRPVSSMSAQQPDTYMLQGSVGTAAIHHVE